MGPSHSVALPRLRAAAGLGVTLTLTAGLLAGLPTVVEPALDPTGRPLGLDDLIVVGCALVLLPAWCRLALGVALCLGETLVRSPRGARGPGDLAPSWLRPALARRVAALVVGSSVGGLAGASGAPLAVAATSVPDDTAARAVLAARSPLPVPQRPVGGLVAATAPRTASVSRPAADAADATVAVRPGDTLWALASRHLVAPGASDGQVDAAWQRLYAANRAALGPDPDLIRPGDRLDLPTSAPTEGHP